VTTQGRPASHRIEVVRVETAEEMADAVLSRYAESDAVVMAAAVADFRPKAVADEKLKKQAGVPEIVLEPTPDILALLGERKTHQMLVGFAAETERLHEHAADKLARKHVDLMVANDVSAPDAGFEVDTNRVTLLSAGPGPGGEPGVESPGIEELPLMEKSEVAGIIVDRITHFLRKEPR